MGGGGGGGGRGEGTGPIAIGGHHAPVENQAKAHPQPIRVFFMDKITS